MITVPCWFMAEYQNVRTGRHCTFVLHAHLVFVTKYRHKVFADRHLTRLEEIMRSVCQDFEVELVKSLKGVSSRRMRQEYPELVKHYWRAQRLWSGSYFAGSVGGAPLSTVR